MENTIVKKIELDNNQLLILSDLSRKISEDAYVVIMKASIEIKIEKDLFPDDSLSDFKFQDILDKIGDKVVYEYKITRNFILNHQKDEVFDAQVKIFLDNLGHYVAKKDFPGKFILKKYKDKMK
ncbi:MAG: hypothetical protein KKE44_02565 [Proteobacteria bacterium]|nr:hypothetical protein [Pseudomonadota bacterium]MBU1581609.1 hypothetical protein [Pseudomonadota bacterium]MBU2454920.1 hypothetical protein [Pseudomonadota bacterium]MBU2629840.1 hypothetical protein [Pseudomonadota bacterium]